MKFPRITPHLFALLCLTASVHAATLTHRYEFGGNLNDSVGGVKVTTPSAGPSMFPLSYGASRPAGASGPVASLEVGKVPGTVSGFAVPAEAFADSGSLAFWFLAEQDNAGEGADYIFNLGGTYNKDLRLSIAANKSVVEVNAASTNTSLGSIKAGTWYHVVITWDRAARTAEVYFNGSLVKSRTWDDPELFSLAPMRVGNWGFSQKYADNQFRGSLYDLQIYSGQLDASEIKRLYVAPGGVIAAIPDARR